MYLPHQEGAEHLLQTHATQTKTIFVSFLSVIMFFTSWPSVPDMMFASPSNHVWQQIIFFTDTLCTYTDQTGVSVELYNIVGNIKSSQNLLFSLGGPRRKCIQHAMWVFAFVAAILELCVQSWFLLRNSPSIMRCITFSGKSDSVAIMVVSNSIWSVNIVKSRSTEEEWTAFYCSVYIQDFRWSPM